VVAVGDSFFAVPGEGSFTVDLGDGSVLGEKGGGAGRGRVVLRGEVARVPDFARAKSGLTTPSVVTATDVEGATEDIRDRGDLSLEKGAAVPALARVVTSIGFIRGSPLRGDSATALSVVVDLERGRVEVVSTLLLRSCNEVRREVGERATRGEGELLVLTREREASIVGEAGGDI